MAKTSRRRDAPGSVPPVRRGGQEPPPEVQDRPEQNRGYDEAAHGVAGPIDEEAADVMGAVPDEQHPRPESPDDHAEREAVLDVRRREHSAD